MGTFDVGHPDVLEFVRAKRENGRLRQFNLSLLITDEFMSAVREERDWKLAFPITRKEYETELPSLSDTASFVWREWPIHDGYVVNDEGLVACKIYKTIPARRLWDVIMTSTYDFAERGSCLIDRVNDEQQLVVRGHPGDESVRDRGYADLQSVRHDPNRRSV